MKNTFGRSLLTGLLMGCAIQASEPSAKDQCLALTAGLRKSSPGVLTAERIAEFRRVFPKLEAHKVPGAGVDYELDLSHLDSKEMQAIYWDLKFLAAQPHLPIENSTASLDNYEPQNESQKAALESARKLVAVEPSRAKSAGLYLYGDPGVGKSHLAVAMAKEFMKAGEAVLFIGSSTVNSSLLSEIPRYRVFVIDDFNSGYGAHFPSIFKAIVLQIHERGGKAFVTSNTDFERLLSQAFIGDTQDLPRVKDRIKGMMKILRLEGESFRKPGSWAD